jgi:putative nucleotidyltransferase with HDIG domain
MGGGVDYKRRVYAIRDLPTLPVIAQKVLTLADDDEDCVEKLTKLIASDQSLAVKILAFANSAYFGHRSKIGTVRHAVGVIGTATLKQFSLSVLVCDMMGRGGKDRTEFWKHSFATATAASLISERAKLSDRDLCFMAGLIHDVGKIIIDTYFPGELGIEHTEVGGWIAERWALPQPLIDAITHHHSTSPEHFTQPIVACVCAANACAKLAFQECAPDVAPEILKALKLKDRDITEIGIELRNRQEQIESLVN